MEQINIIKKIAYMALCMNYPGLVQADGLGGLSLGPMILGLYYLFAGIVPMISLVVAFRIKKNDGVNVLLLYSLLVLPFVYGLYGIGYSVTPPFEIYTSLMGFIGVTFVLVTMVLFNAIRSSRHA